MVTETGNRISSVEEVIAAVLEDDYANSSILEKFFKGTKTGSLVQINCVNPKDNSEYEVIGRIACRFDPDGDIPEAALIERKASNERVPYSHIKGYKTLQTVGFYR